jgi:uncharacterized membrane protein
MSTSLFVLSAIAIGFVAGLRAMTAPMAVAWAARLGWIEVHHTWAAFLARGFTPWIFTVLALAELINDQNPKAPARTATPSFIFRVLSGAFCGAALATGSHQSLFGGIVLGGGGAVFGTLGGYEARKRLVQLLRVPDRVIAIPEDAVAVAGGFLIAALFR